MNKPKAEQHVSREKVPDFILSKLQDRAREIREAIENLALELDGMEQQIVSIKIALGLPVEPFSLRDDSEFYE